MDTRLVLELVYEACNVPSRLALRAVERHATARSIGPPWTSARDARLARRVLGAWRALHGAARRHRATSWAPRRRRTDETPILCFG